MEETIQYLQIITNVIIILLFIGLVILVFTFLKSIKSLSAKFEVLAEQTKEIKVKLDPAIDKFQNLTDNVNGVFSKVNENIDVLSNVIEKVKDTTESIVEFEQKIQSRIEPPVMETANAIAAVSVGIKTFFDTYKMNKRSREINKIENELVDLKDSVEDVNSELDKVNFKLSNN